MKTYDIAVVGAGHAGIEAALAAARLNKKTVIFSISLENIGLMACNPSIGGTAKGHLVREVDALGGEMGIAADRALLQIKMLNRGKGAAVQSLRGQEDKQFYHRVMKGALENQPNLDLIQGEAEGLIVENGEVKGVRLVTGENYYAGAVVLATGVYLNARVIIGDYTAECGPSGYLSAKKLTQNLIDNGFDIRRFKTGTPARLDGNSLDYSKMQIQLGEDIPTFSFMSDGRLINQMPCYLTYTNEKTHGIIRKNIARAPLYNGTIHGVGPRYCPSIEDKIMRFKDKDRHQIFIEPEGADTNEKYVQGLSTSLPVDVQEEMYRTVAGLENCRFMRYAYAIEYDCVNPLNIYADMSAKHLKGVYTAGQINGSSGYEEAAAQGLMAGINASLYLDGKKSFTLTRDEAYIGVLVDDLVTKGTNEPYRMMTARAEYRLYLRQDNADLRLTDKGYELGLVTQQRYDRLCKKREQMREIFDAAKQTSVSAAHAQYIESISGAPYVQAVKAAELLKRKGVTFAALNEITDTFKEFDSRALESAEVAIKYEGYLLKQSASIKEQHRLEEREMPADIDYAAIDGMRIEARQKLASVRPKTLGQASRISGVSPADITVLMVWLKSRRAD